MRMVQIVLLVPLGVFMVMWGCQSTPVPSASFGINPPPFAPDASAQTGPDQGRTEDAVRSCSPERPCDVGEDCINYNCRRRCRVDSDCRSLPIDSICRSRVCEPVERCKVNRDCALGSLCEQGTCTPSCEVDQDCPINSHCQSGQCANGCNSNCECPADHICTNDGLCAKATAPSYTCKVDCDCPAKQTCANRQCQ